LSRVLIDHFAERRPDLDVAVSATTGAGLALARELHGGKPGRFVLQFPLDARFAVRRVFERVRPVALVLVELELWPNVLAEARARGVPVAVVNARVSERSFRRYRRLEPLARLFRGDQQLTQTAPRTPLPRSGTGLPAPCGSAGARRATCSSRCAG